MITYDLRCVEGHVFEAWFKDRQSFLEQKEAGRVECPSCGSTGLEIAFTGCSIQTERRREMPAAKDSSLRQLRLFLEKNFENVGGRFAEEALRMHYGDAKKRNIRGVTTEEEERGLLREGVDFIKLPLPKLDA